MAEKATRKKDPVVFALSRNSRCYNCDSKLAPGAIVKLQDGRTDETEVLCRTCAGLNSLEVLPSGNAKITQLAKKYSTERYIIMKWSELWKCYERQGLLVQPAAIDRAESETGVKLASRERV